MNVGLWLGGSKRYPTPYTDTILMPQMAKGKGMITMTHVSLR
jgi:hypothetical protein